MLPILTTSLIHFSFKKFVRMCPKGPLRQTGPIVNVVKRQMALHTVQQWRCKGTHGGAVCIQWSEDVYKFEIAACRAIWHCTWRVSHNSQAEFWVRGNPWPGTVLVWGPHAKVISCPTSKIWSKSHTSWTGIQNDLKVLIDITWMIFIVIYLHWAQGAHTR